MTGKSEPTEDELKGFEEVDAPDYRVLHSGGKVQQGIPYFWLTVLSNQVGIQRFPFLDIITTYLHDGHIPFLDSS